MKKQIGEGLPDAEEGHYSSGHKTKPLDKSVVRGPSRKIMEECFKNEYGEIGDQEELHTRGNVEIEADFVALDARS